MISLDTLNIRASTRLRRALDQSVFSRILPATKDGSSEAEASSPLSFLLAAASESGEGAAASESIFAGRDRFRAVYTPERLASQFETDPGQEQALVAALLDAQAIRRETGGRDVYLGLRHVLFAIFVPEGPGAFVSTYKALAEAGTTPPQLSQAIADFCRKPPLEPGEKAEVWERLVADRLPGVLNLGITSAPAEEVAALGADDPWAAGVVDRSGATREAEAFAAMICWRQFRPPMAVAVLGDWGAGKSFFMRLTHAAIERQSARARDGDPAFLGNVVQIRFNAWHYAETKLWPSLVDHILTELDQWARAHNRARESDGLLRRLDFAREWTLRVARDLVARRREVQAAEVAHEKAKAAYVEKRQELERMPETWASAAWNEILKDPAMSKEVAAAAADLGLPALDEGAEALRRSVQLYTGGEGRPALGGWAALIGRHPVWAALLILSLFALPPLLVSLLAMISPGISAAGAALAGILSPLAVFATVAARHLGTAHATLAKVQATADASIAWKTKAEAAEAARAAVAAEAARLAEQAAAERLVEAKAAEERLADEYGTQNGKARLLDFVRRRASSDDYRRELSFIALIRRDFDELNRLMNPADPPPDTSERLEAHKRHVEALLEDVAEGELLQSERELLEATTRDPETSDLCAFDRIVLYIDDLDRCSSEQVVVVLQAIHLLLTYPLFVVFVAVDVRWLRQALEAEYSQFAAAPSSGDAGMEARATPGDYLEKIFQIPYWVRPMGAEGIRALLADHLGPARSARTHGAGAVSPPSGARSAPSAGSPKDGDATGLFLMPTPVAETPRIEPVPLGVFGAERDFLEEIAAGLASSPRRTLRFVNSYRLLKAGLAPDQRATLEAGGYRAALFLLALRIAMPEAFRALGRAGPEADARQIVIAAAIGAAQGARMEVLCDAYEAVGDWRALPDWSAQVARFGFEPHP